MLSVADIEIGNKIEIHQRQEGNNTEYDESERPAERGEKLRVEAKNGGHRAGRGCKYMQ